MKIVAQDTCRKTLVSILIYVPSVSHCQSKHGVSFPIERHWFDLVPPSCTTLVDVNEHGPSHVFVHVFQGELGCTHNNVFPPATTQPSLLQNKLSECIMFWLLIRYCRTPSCLVMYSVSSEDSPICVKIKHSEVIAKGGGQFWPPKNMFCPQGFWLRFFIRSQEHNLSAVTWAWSPCHNVQLSFLDNVHPTIESKAWEISFLC